MTQARVWLPILVLLVFTAGVGVLVYVGTSRASPQDTGAQPTVPEKAQEPSEKPPDLPPPEAERPIAGTYITRKGGTAFQSIVRYAPEYMPAALAPGWDSAEDALLRMNEPLSALIAVVEQVGESRLDNLGEPMRSLVSYRAYMNPNGVIGAYDIAMTTGGIPSRFIGYLNRKGVTVEVFQGARKVDMKDFDFPRGTLIMPLEMEFLHHWVSKSKDPTKPVLGRFFVPEAMALVTLAATPQGTETLAHRGSNLECAKYLVEATSDRAQEGTIAKQIMWFDTQSNLLVRRMDYEEGATPDLYPVTERIEPGAADIQPLMLRPPPDLPKPGAFPFELDRDYYYLVRARDVIIGRVKVAFTRQAADESGPAGFLASAQVDLDTQNGTRLEFADTRFDEQWRPLAYAAKGEESGDAKAEYTVSARLRDGWLKLSQRRKVHATNGAVQALPVRGGEDLPKGLGLPDQLLPPAESPDDETLANRPAERDIDLERRLSEGTFLHDFNRVEHLAALVFRLALPAIEKGAEEPKELPVRYQKAALFGVRRNQGGLVLFKMHPEPLPPKPDDPELAAELEKEDNPRLCVVSARGPMLNASMLLSPDGMLMELTERFGSNEVVYTLDDPIMRRRDIHARKRRGQEGPTLLRPPWF